VRRDHSAVSIQEPNGSGTCEGDHEELGGPLWLEGVDPPIGHRFDTTHLRSGASPEDPQGVRVRVVGVAVELTESGAVAFEEPRGRFDRIEEAGASVGVDLLPLLVRPLEEHDQFLPPPIVYFHEFVRDPAHEEDRSAPLRTPSRHGKVDVRPCDVWDGGHLADEDVDGLDSEGALLGVFAQPLLRRTADPAKAMAVLRVDGGSVRSRR
jgi:hypothetical protein